MNAVHVILPCRTFKIFSMAATEYPHISHACFFPSGASET
jgi:hypothetical protein